MRDHSKGTGGRSWNLVTQGPLPWARSGPPWCWEASRLVLWLGRNPFSPSALPAPPEKAPLRATQTQVGLAVQREVTEQVSGPQL